MEPLPKRQRIFAPAHRNSGHSFADQHEYYDDPADNKMMDEEEDYDEEARPEVDPDTQLEQRRARLDYKLKSTFEAIFEKYGKDFDGVGDEIDLATGEILINNGHLTKMQDERDAGDFNKSRMALRGFTAEPEGLPTSSIGETDMLGDEEEYEDIDEDDKDENESASDDGMMDDNMILRGFAKANRFIQKPAELEASNKPPLQERRGEKDRRSSTGAKMLPSRSDILLQFGPQLGPHIAEFVSQQQVSDSPIPDDSHIESAWRVPRIPFPKPLKRKIKKPVKMAPEPERSPSPEAANSIWARDRRKKPVQAPPGYYESLMIDPLSDPMGLGDDRTPKSTPKTIRKNFTPEDGQILLNFVEQARRQNLELGFLSTWDRLGRMHTGHSSATWKKHYELKFTYLWPTGGDEPETSEISVDTARRTGQTNLVVPQSVIKPLLPTRTAVHDRPSRVRRPAVKDPQIFSWSQAVQAIELADPDLHAGILEDTRKGDNVRSVRRSVSSSFSREIDFVPRNAESPPWREHRLSQHQNSRLPNPRRTGENSSNSRGVENFSCAQCFETFNYQSDLDSHGNRTLHASYICVFPGCRFQSPRSSDILQHQMLHQSVAPRFPCTHCKKHRGNNSFNQEDHLHQHILKSHPKICNCSHAECKGLLSKVYNLRRQEGGELSEMCLHLFHEHKITPYPCSELNCFRQGVEGFFTQIDLLRHVNLSHPSIGALGRLRSRVDSKLLDCHIKLMRLPDKNRADDMHESQGQLHFPSSARNVDSRPLSNAQSSSSFGDRTITPRVMNGTIRGAELTPTTSISSIVVHPASGNTALPIRNSESLERFQSATAEEFVDDRTVPETRSSLSVNHKAPASIAPIQVLGRIQLPDPFRSDSVRRSLPTLQASLIRSVGPSSALHRQPVTITPEVRIERHMTTRTRTKMPMPRIIPNSQSFTETFPTSFFDTLTPPKAANPAGIPDTLLRPVDSSYAFSDEEDEPSAPKPAIVGNMLPARCLTRPVVEIYVKSIRELAGEVEPSTIPTRSVQALSPHPSAAVHVVKPSAVASSAIKPIAVEPIVFEPVAVEPIAIEAVKPKGLEPSAIKYVSSNSVPATIIKPIAMLPPMTPASRIPFQGRKSIALNEDEDDFDELSSEQFDMFAHPRTNPQPKTNLILARVKHVENTKSPQVHSVPSRKRKLDVFKGPKITAKPAMIVSKFLTKAATRGEAGPSFEAGIQITPKVSMRASFPVQEVYPVRLSTNTVPKPITKAVIPVQEVPPVDPAIKIEDNEPITLLNLAPTPATKKSRHLRHIPPGPSSMKSPFGRQLDSSIRTGTPLLDLTPGCRKEKRGTEICDSGDEDSSPLTGVSRKAVGVRARTPPVMDRAWDQAPIVLRTPGGTFRKCGEDGFRCRKGFCFACSVEGRIGQGKEKARETL